MDLSFCSNETAITETNYLWLACELAIIQLPLIFRIVL